MTSRTEIETTEEALRLAVYLVMLLNRHVDGRGFGVDAVVLEETRPIRFLNKNETARYSERFEKFERQLGKEFFAG